MWVLGYCATMSAAGLLRRGLMLEFITFGWNVLGVVVLAIAAIGARSVALAGFGLDSLIEIRRVDRRCVGADWRGS